MANSQVLLLVLLSIFCGTAYSSVCPTYLTTTGDTIATVAQKLGIQQDALLKSLQACNQATNLTPGQEICLPGADLPLCSNVFSFNSYPDCKVYKVTSGDTLQSVSSGLQISQTDLASVNSDITNTVLQPGKLLRLPPWSNTCGDLLAAKPVSPAPSNNKISPTPSTTTGGSPSPKPPPPPVKPGDPKSNAAPVVNRPGAAPRRAPAPSPSSGDTSDSGTWFTTTAIIIIVCIIFGLAVIIGVSVWCIKRKKRAKRADEEAPSTKFDDYQAVPPPRPPQAVLKPPGHVPPGHIHWSLALKRPSDSKDPNNRERGAGNTAYCWKKGETHGLDTDIDDWIQSQFSGERWQGYILYNDEPPKFDNSSDPGTGHCKGVIVWNSKTIMWIIHSTPRWPIHMDISQSPAFVPGIRDKQARNGQHFIALRMAYSHQQKGQIVHQLYNMDAFVYQASSEQFAHPWIPNWSIGDKNKVPQPVNPSHVQLGHSTWHIAKCGQVGIDIYGDYLAKMHGPMRWVAQTWVRIKSKDEAHLKEWMNIDKTLVYDVETKVWQDGKPRGSGGDHSKWAINFPDHHRRLVFIGDLNRQTSQMTRGGGGVLIEDEFLWARLWEMVKDDVRANYRP